MVNDQVLNGITIATLLGVGYTQLGWLPIAWAKFKAWRASKPTAPTAPNAPTAPGDPVAVEPPDLATAAQYVAAIEAYFAKYKHEGGQHLAMECGQLLSVAMFPLPKQKVANGTS